MKEQRKSLRFRVQFRSSFSSTSMVGGEGSLLDLSISGCRIESPADVQAGTTLEVRIMVREQESPIEIRQAAVRWSREHQFGLEFVTMTPNEWTRLQQTVEQIETGLLQAG
jgi:hypothetical protein